MSEQLKIGLRDSIRSSQVEFTGRGQSLDVSPS